MNFNKTLNCAVIMMIIVILLLTLIAVVRIKTTSEMRTDKQIEFMTWYMGSFEVQ